RMQGGHQASSAGSEDKDVRLQRLDIQVAKSLNAPVGPCNSDHGQNGGRDPGAAALDPAEVKNDSEQTMKTMKESDQKKTDIDRLPPRIGDSTQDRLIGQVAVTDACRHVVLYPEMS